ncbi:anti-repressor SinI [Bacillus oleivorans]|uniref:Anti-repressor SinI n=1 Tax=Bacillus oleivorans TaxID=1448271 RepID=A0A285CRY7_9BACI|nr:anti-repressor SinI family protein [Bacillus oleivorans]SNX70350.1 anti-repressor SinI [Bacillus oleivorans]
MSNPENTSPLDQEWVQLLKEAKEMGITAQEIKIFIGNEPKKTHEDEV